MERNEIDHIFKEKLGNFEKTPSAGSWEKLALLSSVKPVKKAFPIGWYISGVAATVALILVVRYSILDNNNIESNSKLSQSTEKQDIGILKNKTKEIIANNHTITSENKKETINSVNAKIKNSDVEKSNKNGSEIIYNKLPKVVDSSTQELAVSIHSKETVSEGNLTKNTDQFIISPVSFTKNVISDNRNEGVPVLDAVVIIERDEENQVASTKKKKSKVGRVLNELKHFKKGEKVDFKELGLDKETIVATLKDRFQ